MLLDGKKLSQGILQTIQQEIEASRARKPALALIVVGSHPASLSYIRGKKKACEQIGMRSLVLEKPETISEKELVCEIENLNQDPLIDGILVQLPLPDHIDQAALTAAIDPEKDVDGFHPLNMGKLLLGQEGGFVPCTPKGVFTLLQRYRVPIDGKHVVIVGRSNIVGKPLGALLVQKKDGCNATVTIAHSRSEHLEEITRSADVLIAAIGSPLFIKKEMVKKGAAVIDVGINRSAERKLVGDVDFSEVIKLARWITPVPGGVGPMTIAMLIENTFEGYKKRL
ncbi:MAG: bifunctional methylenetetrahydrofolate dehydrogenase/methenyltetrahydrofolate cyclohydrolase FolD [Chlamydiae bacterium]|nr:bifunctional methylenetetrahydrofolate dehydrogenase/methenyltetrahydrofolate cyclohydrolase FolD [Chlamydiota bacterium]